MCGLTDIERILNAFGGDDVAFGFDFFLLFNKNWVKTNIQSQSIELNGLCDTHTKRHRKYIPYFSMYETCRLTPRSGNVMNPSFSYPAIS